MSLLRIQNIEKYYGNRSNLTKAVDDISFSVEKGEFTAIMGASGSGKTTLLNCISTIDRVTAGHIFLEDQDITQLKGRELGDALLIPQDCLKADEEIFLDDMTRSEVETALQTKVTIVKSNGMDLIRAILGQEQSGEDVEDVNPYELSDEVYDET